MKHILFVCTYYGGRALVARQLARRMLPTFVHVECASFEQGPLGARMQRLVKNIDANTDFDIDSIWDLHASGGLSVDWVISLCQDMSAEQCALFRSNVQTLLHPSVQVENWSIPDFAGLSSDEDIWFAQAERVRQLIEQQIQHFAVRNQLV